MARRQITVTFSMQPRRIVSSAKVYPCLLLVTLRRHMSACTFGLMIFGRRTSVCGGELQKTFITTHRPKVPMINVELHHPAMDGGRIRRNS